KQLVKDGMHIIAPGAGDLACGEKGEGRMAEVETILKAIMSTLSLWERGGDSRGEGGAARIGPHPGPLPEGKGVLKGIRALVTSGPTHEAIDPVRFIGNRSSGRQGHAVA